jgi:hypothetical protein
MLKRPTKRRKITPTKFTTKITKSAERRADQLLETCSEVVLDGRAVLLDDVGYVLLSCYDHRYSL